MHRLRARAPVTHRHLPVRPACLSVCAARVIRDSAGRPTRASKSHFRRSSCFKLRSSRAECRWPL